MIRHPKGKESNLQLLFMPLTIFDVKGIPGLRRERIESAMSAGAKHLPDLMRAGFQPIRSAMVCG